MDFFAPIALQLKSLQSGTLDMLAFLYATRGEYPTWGMTFVTKSGAVA